MPLISMAESLILGGFFSMAAVHRTRRVVRFPSSYRLKTLHNLKAALRKAEYESRMSNSDVSGTSVLERC